MFTILLFAIVMGSVYLLLSPFLNISQMNSLKTIFASNGHRELEHQKDMLVNQIKDIEFDYHLGKLSDDDYSALTREYKLKAASIIKQMDTDENTPPGEVSEQRKYCSGCGAPTVPEANYCQYCGQLLKGGNYDN